jgi:hypothetical protein
MDEVFILTRWPTDGQRHIICGVFGTVDVAQTYVEQWDSGWRTGKLRWLEAAGIHWTITEPSPKSAAYMWQIQRWRINP